MAFQNNKNNSDFIQKVQSFDYKISIFSRVEDFFNRYRQISRLEIQAKDNILNYS